MLHHAAAVFGGRRGVEGGAGWDNVDTTWPRQSMSHVWWDESTNHPDEPHVKSAACVRVV